MAACEQQQQQLNVALVENGAGQKPQDDRCLLKAWERCIAASCKGFAIGAGLRGGLALFAVLTRLRRSRNILLRSKSSKRTDRELIKDALKETLRYGLFLSTFAGTFTTVDELIAAVVGFKRSARWRALLAGSLAGPALLLTGPNTRHTSMALYIFMRAAVLAARCGIKSKSLGWFFFPLSWRYGEVLLMCLSSSQILSAWILKPTSLPSSYVAFLNKHGGKDSSIVRGIRELANGSISTKCITQIEECYNKNGTTLRLDPTMKIPCTIIHGNQTCAIHFVRFIGEAYLRSLPVYLPVYLAPALIVHRQGLLKKPYSILGKTLLGTARSSLFLATYCASAWICTCVLFRSVGRCNPAMLAVGTFPTGLALMLEKKSRQMEIALYCFSRAIESFGLCVSDSNAFRNSEKRMLLPNRVDVLLFSFSTAIIMHCYAQEREVFRSKYLNVLDWVFGIPELKNTPNRLT